jgi:hypothetical protein
MKRFAVTEHAIERTVERLGVEKVQACKYLNQLMQTAYLTGRPSSPRGGRTRVFDHYGSRVRIIVASEEDRIITVYKFPEQESQQSLPAIFADDIRKTVQRKFNAAKREYKRNSRRLEEELAELNLELAQLRLNRVRAKSPRTVASIDRKIAAKEPKVDALANALNEVVEKFNAIKSEVEEFV